MPCCNDYNGKILEKFMPEHFISACDGLSGRYFVGVMRAGSGFTAKIRRKDIFVEIDKSIPVSVIIKSVSNVIEQSLIGHPCAGSTGFSFDFILCFCTNVALSEIFL